MSQSRPARRALQRRPQRLRGFFVRLDLLDAREVQHILSLEVFIVCLAGVTASREKGAVQIFVVLALAGCHLLRRRARLHLLRQRLVVAALLKLKAKLESNLSYFSFKR